MLGTKKQHLAIGMLRHKSVPLSVSSAELAVQRTLQNWLEFRGQIKAQFERRHVVFQGHFHEPVNGGFVEGEFDQFNHSAGGLEQSRFFVVQSECMVMVDLGPTAFEKVPAK
jgi:hypothetical protein